MHTTRGNSPHCVWWKNNKGRENENTIYLIKFTIIEIYYEEYLRRHLNPFTAGFIWDIYIFLY